MINKNTIELLRDSVLSGATAGGTLNVIEDSPLLDDPKHDMALKLIVSVFSAFIVPMVSNWLKKRKTRREVRRKAKTYNSQYN